MKSFSKELNVFPESTASSACRSGELLIFLSFLLIFFISSILFYFPLHNILLFVHTDDKISPSDFVDLELKIPKRCIHATREYKDSYSVIHRTQMLVQGICNCVQTRTKTCNAFVLSTVNQLSFQELRGLPMWINYFITIFVCTAMIRTYEEYWFPFE